MDVPSQFQILGHTIAVEIVPIERWEHSDCVAYYAAERDKLYLRSQHSDALLKHAFWHEVVHAIFCLLNRDKLYKREVLVDNVGAVLAQIMETAE